MKICILGNSLTVLSGHARPAYVLAGELLGLGHQVTILAQRSPAVDQSKEDAILASLGLASLNVDRRLGSLPDILTGDNASIRELWRILGEHDVAHCFDLTTLWLLRRAFGGVFPCATVCSVASDTSIKLREVIRQGYGPALRVATTPSYLMSMIAGERLLPIVLAVPDAVIATSHHIARRLEPAIGSSERLQVVYPGLVTNLPRPATQRTTLEPTFLYFGWHSGLRGAQDVVSAFEHVARQLPGARLKLAIRGTDENIEDRILFRRNQERSMGERITCTGFDGDVPTLLDSVDVVVLPFRSSFGYSQPAMVLLEAMSAGRAVISTPVGSVPEVLEDGVTGILTPPEDVPALTRHMLALAGSPELRARRGASARERVVAMFAPALAAPGTLAVYEKARARARLSVSSWSRNGARAAYSELETARTYDAVRFTTTAGTLFDGFEKAELERGVGPSLRAVLEVGTGTARLASHLARLGHQVVASEVSEPMLAAARQRLAEEDTAGRVRAVRADGYQLPFRDGAFEVAYAVRVLNQLYADDDKAAVLAEMFRVVKPGGTVFFDFVNATSLARLAQPAGLISLSDVLRLVECELGGRVTQVTGRLVLSETLLHRVHSRLAPAAERLDAAVSALAPGLATRVYVTAVKLESDRTRAGPPPSPPAFALDGMLMSGAVVLAYAFSAAASYMYSTAAARGLGPDSFSALSAILSLQVMLGTTTSGIGSALMILGTRYAETGRPGAVVTALLAPIAALVVVSALLGAWLSFRGSEVASFFQMGAPDVFFVALAGFVLVFGLAFIRAMQLALGDGRGFLANLCVESGARAALAVVLLETTPTVTDALLLYYGAALAGLACALLSLRRRLSHRPEWIDLWELIVLSSRGTGAYLMACILTSADVPLARHFLPPVAAGVYAAASTIAKVALLISAAMVEPHLAYIASDPRARSVRIGQLLRQISCVCGLWALGCLIVPESIYIKVFGASYAGIVPLVGLLSVGAAVNGVLFAGLRCLVVARLRYPAAGLIAASIVLIGGTWASHGSALAFGVVNLAAAALGAVCVVRSLISQTRT